MKTNEVSRNLRLAAKLSKNLAEDRTLSLKTLLFQNKYRFYVSYLFISLHFDLVSALIKLWTDLPNPKNSLFILVLLTFLQNVQAVYALINEIIKHDNDLNEILEKIDLLKIEKRLDPWLAKAFLTEILWGKRKLLGDGPLSKSILSYENECRSILGHTDRDKTSERSNNERVIKPRYVRINTLLTSAADAIKNFQDEGWQLVRCKNDSYDEYLKQLSELREDQFIPDFHVKVVFAFPPNTVFYNHQLYLNSEIFLQDKATSLAALLLSPTPGSTVLDMCAAPGMKTTHLAAIMRNEGTVYAVEQNEKRCEVLKQFAESSGATCIKVINKDVLTVNKDECPNVDYILLDPSCSGSGMPRMEQNDFDYDFKSGRLKKLTNFQAKLLRHALNEFRSAKRLVYSTCSLYPQENEEVLLDVIKNHKGDFELVSAKELLNNNWNNTGDPKYFEIGEKCIYARPNSDQTIGVFLAVFDRKIKKNTIDDSEAQIELTENFSTNDKKNLKKNKKDKLIDIEDKESNITDYTENKFDQSEMEEQHVKKKKRKHNIDNEIITEFESNSIKKKKKKNQSIDPGQENISEFNNEQEISMTSTSVQLEIDDVLDRSKSKKKSKSKDKSSDSFHMENECEKKKKKKFKSSLKEHEVENDLKSPKSFDKHKKLKDFKKNKIIQQDVEIESTNLQPETLKKKKSKKLKDICEQDDSEQSVEIKKCEFEENSENIKSKKKKKCK